MFETEGFIVVVNDCTVRRIDSSLHVQSEIKSAASSAGQIWIVEASVIKKAATCC